MVSREQSKEEVISQTTKTNLHNQKVDWKAILRESAEQIYDKSPLSGERDQMRLNHDPMPNDDIQRKVDYFYLNHNYEQKVGTSMQETYDAIFLGDVQNRTGWEHMHEFITSKCKT